MAPESAADIGVSPLGYIELKALINACSWAASPSEPSGTLGVAQPFTSHDDSLQLPSGQKRNATSSESASGDAKKVLNAVTVFGHLLSLDIEPDRSTAM